MKNPILVKLIGVVIFLALLTMCNSHAIAINIPGAATVQPTISNDPFHEVEAFKGEPLTSEERQALQVVSNEINEIKSQPENVAFLGYEGLEVQYIYCFHVKGSIPKLGSMLGKAKGEYFRCKTPATNKIYQLAGGSVGGDSVLSAGLKLGIYVGPSSMKTLSNTYWFLSASIPIPATPFITVGAQVSLGSGCFQAASHLVPNEVKDVPADLGSIDAAKIAEWLRSFKNISRNSVDTNAFLAKASESCQALLLAQANIEVPGMAKNFYDKIKGMIKKTESPAETQTQLSKWSKLFKNASLGAHIVLTEKEEGK